MTQLIKYLDKIAKEKQRDVLMLSFVDYSKMNLDKIFDLDAEQCKPRMEVIAWLEANEYCDLTHFLLGEMNVAHFEILEG